MCFRNLLGLFLLTFLFLIIFNVISRLTADVIFFLPSREGMMSYKQFIQELEDDILPSEAERRSD